MHIPVYKQEMIDGLDNLVRANHSISYITPVSPAQLQNAEHEWTTDLVNKMVDAVSAKANRQIDRIDLYPIKTVLVTTGWNKNTDIFTKEQTWAARFSAEDKPFNFMHEQKDIIGHITDNFIVDDNGKAISSESAIEDVPDKFHIITPAVIYKAWEDKDQSDRIKRLIAEIDEGHKWYVSMECLFYDFDYGILTPDGESRVIARNEKTAALTKMLRQYGGPGKIDGGYSIGRVLKNIVFSGKGLVSNPANPESVILNNTKTFKSISADLGYIDLNGSNTINSKGKNIMAEVNQMVAAELKTFNIEENSVFKMVKAERDELKASLAELTKKLSETSTQAVEKEITSLKDQVKDLTDKLTTASKSVEELTATNKTLATKNEELEAAVTKAEKERVKTERVSSLIALGAAEEEAVSIVAKFENVSAEQFKDMVELVKDKWAEAAKKKNDKKDAKNNDDDADDPADNADMADASKVVDSAQAKTDAPLGVTTDVNELESVAASITEWYKKDVRGQKNKKD